jgi:hypothetical protein
MQPLFFRRHPSTLFADEFGIFNDIHKCIKALTDIFWLPLAELFCFLCHFVPPYAYKPLISVSTDRESFFLD